MKISYIYSQSFRVIKKYKVLWVFGLAVLAFEAAGAGFGNGFNNASKFTQKFEGSPSATTAGPQDVLEKLQPFLTALTGVFSQVPSWIWIVLLLGLLIATIFSFLLTLFLRSWAVGSLVGGTYDALDDRNEISLATVGYRGLRSFKSLSALYVIPSLILILGLLAFGVLAGLAAWGNMPIIAVIIGMTGLSAFVLGCVLASLAELWAERLIAIDGIPWWPAFTHSFRIYQNHLWDTLKLGFVNTVGGCCLGCLTTAIIGPVIGILVLIGLIPVIGWALIPLLIPVVLLIILISLLISGIILAFKYTTWSALYKNIREAQK